MVWENNSLLQKTVTLGTGAAFPPGAGKPIHGLPPNINIHTNFFLIKKCKEVSVKKLNGSCAGAAHFANRMSSVLLV